MALSYRRGYAVVPSVHRKRRRARPAHKYINNYSILLGAANRTRTCDPVITNGHRREGPDRAGHLPGRYRHQGSVRSVDSHERGSEGGAPRVFQNDLDAYQHLPDPEREVEG